MFQPETEDMLPRSAPKPSVPLDMNTAAIVRPTVPEVSILFGSQQPTTDSGAIAAEPPQTYAAWKKQVLPKVTFPPIGSEVYSINGHVLSPAGMSNATSGQALNEHTSIGGGSNQQIATPLYPLRPISTTTVPCVSVRQQQQATTQVQQFRRSLDQPLYLQQNTQETSQRRSLEEYPISCGIQAPAYVPPHTRDVLTICAGTQTDAALLVESPSSKVINPTHLENLVRKEEYQHILALLGEMRTDQMRLMNVIESLLTQHQQPINATHHMVQRQDASTQYTDVPCEARPTRDECEDIEEYGRLPPTAHDRYQPAYMLGSSAPQHQHPVAQSTVYQQYTPRITHTSPRTNAPMSNKPNNEKSMLMNQLAMKYLPNEQLNELLQELNIGTPNPPQTPTTPLRAIENLDKRPGDISNASYKYLKKYRLLPEEQQQFEAKEQLTPVRSPLTHLGAKHQQIPEQCQQQHTATPRVRNSQEQAPMLDLENIKRQPKLI